MWEAFPPRISRLCQEFSRLRGIVGNPVKVWIVAWDPGRQHAICLQGCSVKRNPDDLILIYGHCECLPDLLLLEGLENQLIQGQIPDICARELADLAGERRVLFQPVYF